MFNVNACLGQQLGTILALSLSGVIADTIGWESIFYVFGAIALVWFGLWMMLIHDTPAKHPRISEVKFESLTYVKIFD